MTSPQELLEEYSDEEAFCKKHGSTTVVKTGIMDGYAGEVCYFWKLECGCTLIGDVDDIMTSI